MKILFRPGYFWNYSAPTVMAEPFVESLGATRLRVWCPHSFGWESNWGEWAKANGVYESR